MRQDRLAMCILPFVGFMIASTVVSAFFVQTELGYPIKAITMGAMLWYFLPALRSLNLELHWLPALIGGAIGVLWLLSAPEADTTPLQESLAALPTALFLSWVILRVVGTSVFVPIIEELFFRGYILTRLNIDGRKWRIPALIISSALFGLLHGRWIEGGLAGLAFGLLALWRGKVEDAIWAHAIANALIALVAIAHQNWALI